MLIISRPEHLKNMFLCDDGVAKWYANRFKQLDVKPLHGQLDKDPRTSAPKFKRGKYGENNFQLIQHTFYFFFFMTTNSSVVVNVFAQSGVSDSL